MKCEKCGRMNVVDQHVIEMLGGRYARLCTACLNLWTERIRGNGLLAQHELSEMERVEILARMRGGDNTLGAAWRSCLGDRLSASVALWNDSAAWLAEPMPAAPEATSDVRDTLGATASPRLLPIDTLGWRSCVHRINSRCNSLAERVAKLEDVTDKLAAHTNRMDNHFQHRSDKLAERVAKLESRVND